MTSVKKQIPGMKRLTLRRRSPVTMRIAVRHPSWPRYHPKTTDATAAVTRAVIAVTQSSRTSTLRPTRKLKRGCIRRVPLMSTQSFLVTEVRQIATGVREKKRRRTKTANAAQVRIRSIVARRETVPPLRRGRRLRHQGVSTDPLTRLIARLLDAMVSAYYLLCSHARHNLPAPYVKRRY